MSDNQVVQVPTPSRRPLRSIFFTRSQQKRTHRQSSRLWSERQQLVQGSKIEGNVETHTSTCVSTLDHRPPPRRLRDPPCTQVIHVAEIRVESGCQLARDVNAPLSLRIGYETWLGGNLSMQGVLVSFLEEPAFAWLTKAGEDFIPHEY